MAKRFDKMTPREKFVRLMVRGWKEKKKGYANDLGYGDPAQNKFCAFGVVASELGLHMGRYGVEDILGEEIPYRITTLSDHAGSKTKAIKLIRQELLGR